MHGKIVVEECAYNRTQDTDQHHDIETHLSLIGKVACGYHDHFTGKREKGTLQEHEKKDAPVAHIADRIDKIGSNVMQHGAIGRMRLRM